jgi:hypothetical protein
VKYLRGLELLFNLIFVTMVLHMTLLASMVAFRCVSRFPSLNPRNDSTAIAMRF